MVHSIPERGNNGNWEFESASPKATEESGERLAACLQGGEVLLLVGDLGSGKTTFVRGLARGLGVDDPGGVSSPSYTIVNEHAGGRLLLVHADLYRLDRAEEIDDLALEDLMSEKSVLAIEWGDRLPSPPPGARTVEFIIVSPAKRRIRLC